MLHEFRGARGREATFQDAETSSLEPSESGFSPSLIVQEETVLAAQIEIK